MRHPCELPPLSPRLSAVIDSREIFFFFFPPPFGTNELVREGVCSAAWAGKEEAQAGISEQAELLLQPLKVKLDTLGLEGRK